MPGTRTHGSRSRSRPYDRRSPATSPPAHHEPSPPRTSPIPSIPTDNPGLPTYAEYKRIEAGYLHGLSPRKRDKALITQAMFDKIWDVLHQPDACTIDTPQFRFWVRKMFVLGRPASEGQPEHAWEGRQERQEYEAEEAEEDRALERAMGIARGTDADALLLAGPVVLHEHRPVAIMEQLYELFCYCHVRAGHGGRDKTCAVIRQHYAWVPKELTAQFVKACPTCARKRSGCVEQGGGGRGKRTGKLEAPVFEPASLGWLTTGGPLDPAPLCGVRESPLDAAPRTDLPSLASALSNESLDDSLILAGPGDGDGAAGECLPPALRPLRLAGPLLGRAGPDDTGLFQIDPALLVLGCPATGGSLGLDGPGMSCCPRGVDRPENEDAFRTRACRRASPAFKPLSRLYGCGYDNGSGPLATMLLPCSTDERDQFSVA